MALAPVTGGGERDMIHLGDITKIRGCVAPIEEFPMAVTKKRFGGMK